MVWITIVALVISAGFWFAKPVVDLSPMPQKTAAAKVVTSGTAKPSVSVRKAALEAFFTKHRCLDADLADYYIYEADQVGMDWRLLPAISFKESTCGRAYINSPTLAKNNFWGYGSASALREYPDLEAGIYNVYSHLKNDRYYAGKSIEAILKTYGPSNSPGYAASVMGIMSEISK